IVKYDTKDWDDNSEFTYKTPFGSVSRFGPGLNIFDEDTLIGLMHIARDKKLDGHPTKMPAQLTGDGSVVVHVGETSALELNRFLRRGVSEPELEATRASVSRLSKTTLQIYSSTTDVEGDTKFFDYVGQRNVKGKFLVQFRPEVVKLFEQYVVLDFDLRTALSDTGKAVHRFLCSINKNRFSIKLDDLATAISYSGRKTDFKNTLFGTKTKPSQLEMMQKKGFIVDYELQGTGRKIPYSLSVTLNRSAELPS
ncbi:replication initiation protein, partial [Bermanella marisrubri]